MKNLTFQLDTPYLSYEEYAKRAGISLSLVRRQAREGKLPIKKKTNPKDTPFVNMVALYQMATMESKY